MSKFNTRNNNDLPEVSTASLPDIVFMLLFFFMTVTVMKDNTLKIENNLPNASETKKLEKKDRIIYLYIGKPTKEFQKIWGSEPRIQANDKFIKVSEVGDYILSTKAKMPENIRNVMTTALKIDKNANVGLISDVKQELRKVNALKINYTTYQGDAFANIE
ncbi:biopolymer transport protein ExbD [Saonia flava]|uniref:Biopolymer transport protein ExbD n=1 Tax=Saonia flava TaxID=523696 RepID=A0A846QSG5_9FLAO|nr:biopolymer transporter ExbD [Saonia flava]NJB70998.1 biopolymer transport protein ExbD [Saonia flava]